MNKEVQIFSNPQFGNVRILELNGELWFVGNDIATALGYEKPRNAIVTHVDEDDALKQGVADNLGRVQETTLINESGMYSLIFGSKLPSAKAFKKWVTNEVLPSIRKTGGYSVVRKQNLTPTKVRTSIEWVKGVKELLNLNDSSVLTLVKQVAEPLGLPTPDYTESKDQLLSASELLKRTGSGMSAQAFNIKMKEKGLITELERPSRKGTKKFKSLTGAGLDYGENQVNPSNPKETQPLYYENKFSDLLAVLEVK